MSTDYPFPEPVDPHIGCRHCGDPLLAVAEVRDGRMGVSGLREYRWRHVHGSNVCRPTTTAKPFDAWRATAAVGAVLDARAAADEAAKAAIEAGP